MSRFESFKLVPVAPLALLIAATFAQQAQAATQAVSLNVLNAAVTLPTPLLAGDNLRLDTLVTTQVGALLQTITFTVGAGVCSFSGQAAWEVSTAAGTGPRLIGVNLDVFNASNVLVASDTFAATSSGFATSSFASTVISPGVYRLVATGTGVGDSSLDVTLSFAPVPEPGTLAMLLAGLGVVGLLARKWASASPSASPSAWPADPAPKVNRPWRPRPSPPWPISSSPCR